MYQVLSLLSCTLERSGFYNVGIMSQVFKKSPGEGVAGGLGCTLYISLCPTLTSGARYCPSKFPITDHGFQTKTWVL